MTKVLFVCLGNICRSPIAEGVFNRLIKERGLEKMLECDSAGTIGFHSGELPNVGARQVARKHDIDLLHRSRMIRLLDFDQFDYIMVMDENNYRDVKDWAAQYKGDHNFQIFMMRDFDNNKSGKGVDDPYGGNSTIFENCYQILNESCVNFLDYLINENKLA